MHFGAYFYKMRIFSAFTLKDKRMVRASMVKRIGDKFHLAVREASDQDTINVLSLACANLAPSEEDLRITFDRILDFIEDNYPVEVYDTVFEVY